MVVRVLIIIGTALLAAPLCSFASNELQLPADRSPVILAEAQQASFAELEVLGARIGKIHILNQEIFDLNDPEEDNFLFRLANTLHIQTRRSVVERELLFKSGDPLSARLIDESERLLRSNRYFYDVRLRLLAYRDGVADIEVMTRDAWTLDAGISLGRSGGSNSSTFAIKEYNLAGTGASVAIGHSSNTDRASNEISFGYNRAFDGRTSINFSSADNSDGKRHAASIIRPFYSLDARWAAGAAVVEDDRIESVYSGGAVASQYRHQQSLANLFGGWSAGQVNGWTKRYSVGLLLSEDIFRPEPVVATPVPMAIDQKVIAPYVRYELIEENYERLNNRNQMGRPEFFALGLSTSVQLGKGLSAIGSVQEPWLYTGTISKGYAPSSGHELLTSASLSGQYVDGRAQRQLLTGTASYYWPLNKRLLLYGAVTADRLTNPATPDLLTLGGDNGLRGYPLRYQTGERRAILTMEARAFSELYLFKLFRIGGAAFYDVGSTWGGPHSQSDKPVWLSNVGIGLRIFVVRSAFGNVLHADLATPLNRDNGIKSVQFLLKTKTSF